MAVSRLPSLLLWFVVTMDTGNCTDLEYKFRKVNTGLTVGGSTLQTHSTRSNLECANMCFIDSGCLYYQFGTPQGKICLIIGPNMTQDDVFTVKKDYHVYKKDPCAYHGCVNGGTCQGQGISYKCTCNQGFNGSRCEIDIDECGSLPCQNGGNCSDAVNGYTCSCTAGYDGTLCGNNIDECSSNPCEVGTNCMDSVNGYTCQKTWPTSDEIVFYHGFENEDGFTNNGATLVQGIVGDYAAQLVAAESDYIDFGTTANAACMVMGNCPNGGTISVWLKTPSNNTGGYLTSFDADYTGFYYQYFHGLRHVYLTEGGVFEVTGSIPHGWFHSVMVVTIGPEITVYINAVSVGSDSTPVLSYSPGSGQLVVGRQYIDQNYNYNDLYIDELAFWNRPLTTQEIQDLYTAHSG